MCTYKTECTWALSFSRLSITLLCVICVQVIEGRCVVECSAWKTDLTTLKLRQLTSDTTILKSLFASHACLLLLWYSHLERASLSLLHILRMVLIMVAPLRNKTHLHMARVFCFIFLTIFPYLFIAHYTCVEACHSDIYSLYSIVGIVLRRFHVLRLSQIVKYNMTIATQFYTKLKLYEVYIIQLERKHTSLFNNLLRNDLLASRHLTLRSISRVSLANP